MTEPAGPTASSIPPGLVPRPVQVDLPAGAPFVLGPGVRVVAGPHPAAVSTGILLADRISQVCGFTVPVVQEDDGGPAAIVVTINDDARALGLPAGLAADLRSEAYRLEVTADRVTLAALDGPGLVRGAVTLQQLSGGAEAGGDAGTSRTDEPITITPATVVDHPRFAWRGLSIDLGRHFFGLEDLKALIAVTSGLKLNVLHLHLSDDQGWRLQIPSRPLLTIHSSSTAVGGDPGGFLSTQDYAELQAYAAARHVTVVPEIDVPGHVNAALHAYGELTPSGERAEAYTGIDVGFSRLYADLPATEPFVRDVFGDVARMTAGRYVHVGGDEVFTMDADEYAALVTIALDAVRAGGKEVVGWQEVSSVLTDATAPGAVVQYWDERSTAAADAVTAAAKRGARVLLSPATKTYLDLRYDADSPIGLEWAGHVELRDSYLWEPLEVLPDVPAGQVVGVEAAIWTETIRTTRDLYWLLLPRLAAVAEVAWSDPALRDWDDFAARVRVHARRWDDRGLSWYRSPQVDWLD